MTSRVSRFVAIGGLGFAVQMGVAAALLAVGLTPLAATILAIEAAILHNHAWHRRWAWRDRAGAMPWPLTLTRAHAGAGGTSLVVGTATVAALSGWVTPLAAQAMAVAVCAVANYWLADRWVFARPRPVTFFVLGALLVPATVQAAGPSPDARRSWDRYVAALESARGDGTRGAGWATDEDPDGARTLARLRRGDIVVARRTLPDVDVRDATIEHWQGSVLLRGVSLDDVAWRLRNPDRFPLPPDVRALRVSQRTASGHELYLRLTRSMLVSATYDTWHSVRFVSSSTGRAESVSTTSRVHEVHDAGTPAERRLDAAEGSGFLWQMQSRWRFSAVAEGVVVTCESVTLSRPVPTGLGLVARPIITRVARESMATAVRAWMRGWQGR